MAVSQRHIVALAALAALLVVGIMILMWSTRSHGGLALDAPISRAFVRLDTVHSYTQHVDTHISFPDRTLDVAGTYIVNEPKMIYSTESTTTLTIPGVTEHPSFSLGNISIGSDIYTTVTTQSPMLKNAIETGPWRHFKADAVPPTLKGIAIAGPVLDNLALLRNRGSFLTLVKKNGTEVWGDEKLLRYTFTIAARAAQNQTAVAALVERIGPGTVDVWIDPDTADVRHLVFANPPYYSTTTISRINDVPEILAPIAVHEDDKISP